MRSKRVLGRLALAAGLAVPAWALAQDSATWVNPSTGNWSDSANWSSNPIYPDTGMSVVFPADTWNTPARIIVDAPVAVSGMQFNGGRLYTVSGPQAITLNASTIIDVQGPGGFQGINWSYEQLHSGLNPLLVGHRIDGPISANGLIKAGPGALILGGTNSLSGPVTINGGTLVFLHSAAEGNASSDPIILNGGAIDSFQTQWTDPGRPVTIGPNGGTLSAVGRITELNGEGEANFVTPLIGYLGSVYTPEITGIGNFNGHLNIATGFAIRGNGSLPSVGSITLSGSLSLSGSAQDRVADDATITFHGGRLETWQSVETVGPLILQSGFNIISGSLTTSEIVRNSRGTATISGLHVTGAPPLLAGNGAAGAPFVGIVPWATSGSGPVTFEDGAFRALTASEFVTGVPASKTMLNLKTSGEAQVASTVTVNSLTVNGGTLSGYRTMTITSGAVFTNRGSGTMATISAPLNFGGAEGIIHASSILQLDSRISGSAGLTLSGGPFYIRGRSKYTGPTGLVGSTIYLDDDVIAGEAGPFGIDSSAVRIDDGQWGFWETGIIFRPGEKRLLFTRGLVMHEVGWTSFRVQPLPGAKSREVEISGDVQLGGFTFLQGYDSSVLVFSGDVSGPGFFQVYGDQNLQVTLSGNNSFTGGVQFQDGSLHLGSDSALGTGRLWIAGDSPTSVGPKLTALNGARTIANPIVARQSFATGGSNPITFTGPIDLTSQRLRVNILSAAAPTTFSGQVFNGSLDKWGPGPLSMSNVRMQQLTIGAGPFRIIPNGSSGGTSRVNALTFYLNGSLDLTDNAFIIDYSGASPVASFQQYVSDGTIFSSMETPKRTLGYAENSALHYSTFSGQPVDSTSLLIKYTWSGDANLDGLVNLYDLVMLANGWQSAGPWTSGDFNYDGIVNSTDLALLAMNWQAGDGAPLGQALDELGLPATTIPEPVVGLTLSLIFLPRRRNLHTSAA